jgi:hypothetical protein
MKIAHLILAHNNPKQLEQLIKRLTYADDAVYIHLDKKTAMVAYQYLEQLNNVYFVRDRVKVKWGAYSIVEATLRGFKAIINSGVGYNFVNLLSGCDYPLQTPAHIHNFLEQNEGKAFMSYLPIDTEWQEALPRISYYHLTNYPFPGCHTLQKMLNDFLPKRKMPDGLIPVGRSQWFTTPIDCIKYLVNYLEHNSSVRHFMKLTWGPDEFIFQTILYNSPYRGQMVNTNLRYIDWSAGGASPKTFTMADKEALLSSKKLYARKFDIINHADIMQEIDRKLDNKNELLSA